MTFVVLTATAVLALILVLLLLPVAVAVAVAAAGKTDSVTTLVGFTAIRRAFQTRYVKRQGGERDGGRKDEGRRRGENRRKEWAGDGSEEGGGRGGE